MACACSWLQMDSCRAVTSSGDRCASGEPTGFKQLGFGRRFCASSFTRPKASRRSEDYVHAGATASGTFPLAYLPSSSPRRPDKTRPSGGNSCIEVRLEPFSIESLQDLHRCGCLEPHSSCPSCHCCSLALTSLLLCDHRHARRCQDRREARLLRVRRRRSPHNCKPRPVPPQRPPRLSRPR